VLCSLLLAGVLSLYGALVVAAASEENMRITSLKLDSLYRTGLTLCPRPLCPSGSPTTTDLMCPGGRTRFIGSMLFPLARVTSDTSLVGEELRPCRRGLTGGDDFRHETLQPRRSIVASSSSGNGIGNAGTKMTTVKRTVKSKRSNFI
jgi:hypothetical protein